MHQVQVEGSWSKVWGKTSAHSSFHAGIITFHNAGETLGDRLGVDGGPLGWPVGLLWGYFALGVGDLDQGISIQGSQSRDLNLGISIQGSRPRRSIYIYIYI